MMFVLSIAYSYCPADIGSVDGSAQVLLLQRRLSHILLCVFTFRLDPVRTLVLGGTYIPYVTCAVLHARCQRFVC